MKLDENVYAEVVAVLPPPLQQCPNEQSALQRVYPLITYLKPELQLKLVGLFDTEELGSSAVLDYGDIGKVVDQFDSLKLDKPLLLYRLPKVMGEYPLANGAVNRAIDDFNLLIESYYQAESGTDITELEINLNMKFQALLKVLAEQSSLCDKTSVHQIIRILASYSANREEIWQRYPKLLSVTIPLESSSESEVLEEDKVTFSPSVVDIGATENIPNIKMPLKEGFAYNRSDAGLLTTTTSVIHNAFGMKVAGHLDALSKTPPKLIAEDELYLIIFRQLSQRLTIEPEKQDALIGLIKVVLQELDLQFEDGKLSPFSKRIIASISSYQVLEIVRGTARSYFEEGAFSKSGEDHIFGALANYIYEFLHAFQTNPGVALGIGANWDGTVSLTNSSGANAFKFHPKVESWAQRFRAISEHRQGPSEAFMNAGKGVKYELKAMLFGYDYMTSLKPTEYGGVIYNALIDNAVSIVLPDPAYRENTKYTKCRRVQTVRYSASGVPDLSTHYIDCLEGTFCKGKKGEIKQTPMFRRAGTLEVMPFPRDTANSEGIRNASESSGGNPLAAMQIQHALNSQSVKRGDWAYNPVGPDVFIEDTFYGQVHLYDNKDSFSHVGVMPKHFDRAYKIKKEVCASFVIRMMQSSNVMEYCPAMNEVLYHVLAQFLPESEPPKVPEHLQSAAHIVAHRDNMLKALKEQPRDYKTCETHYFKLFKNLVYSLHPYCKDESIYLFYVEILNSMKSMTIISRANIEQLIRALITNKPVNPLYKTQYAETIKALTELTDFFYPTPSEDFAEQLAAVMSAQATACMTSETVRNYFADLTQSGGGISRKQSPGMLYTKLKYDGASPDIAHDFHKMHTENFHSGYRDPQGYQIVQPEFRDKLMDSTVKTAGMLTQLSHKYSPLGLFVDPFIQPYLQARQAYAKHKHNKIGWGALAATKGFFYNGLLVGGLKTASSPVRMAVDGCTVIIKRYTGYAQSDEYDNPIVVNSAPPNVSGNQVKIIHAIRNKILEIVSEPENSSGICRANLLQLCKTELVAPLLRQYLPEYDFTEKLKVFESEFPYEDLEEGKFLFDQLETILASFYDQILATVLRENIQSLTQLTVSAAFKCMLAMSSGQSEKAAISQVEKAAKLQRAEKKLLKKIIHSYCGVSDKQEFIELFQPKGKLETALELLVAQSHKVESYCAGFVIDQISEKAPELLKSEIDLAYERWYELEKGQALAQFIPAELGNELFVHFIKKAPKKEGMQDLFVGFKQSFDVLRESPSQDAIAQFHACYQHTLKKLSDAQISHDLSESITDFYNQSLCVYITQKLKVDIFDYDYVFTNPLADEPIILSWLTNLLKNNTAFRQFLKFQSDNAGSLDESLFRFKCLFQILEQPGTRIEKTGVQKLIRLWISQPSNRTKLGHQVLDEHSTEKSIEPMDVQDTLFSGSSTMTYALDRVKTKMGRAARRALN